MSSTEPVLSLTVFVRPHGQKQIVPVNSINQSDKDFLLKQGVKISAENLGHDSSVMLYFDYGAKTPEGEPNEYLKLVNLDKCSSRQVFAEAVEDLRLLGVGGTRD